MSRVGEKSVFFVTHPTHLGVREKVAGVLPQTNHAGKGIVGFTADKKRGRSPFGISTALSLMLGKASLAGCGLIQMASGYWVVGNLDAAQRFVGDIENMCL